MKTGILVLGEPEGLAQSLKASFASKNLDVNSVTTQGEADQFLSDADVTLVIGDFTSGAISFLQWVRAHPAKRIREIRFFFVVNAVMPAMVEVQETYGVAFITPTEWHARGIANFGNLGQAA